MNTLSTYVIKNCLISQVGIGLFTNTFLLLFHIFTLLQNHKPKPTELTISHLVLVHVVMLLVVVFLVSPDLSESLNYLNDFKCKAFFFVNRVMRGLSICTTCLLSMIQAITISPHTSWLAKFKHKPTDYIVHVFSFSWFLSLSSSSYLIFYTVASPNGNQTNLLVLSKHCSLSPMSYIIKGLFFTLTISRDVFLVGIMLLSSAYMVIVLFKHQRRFKYLHSTSLSSKVSPEKRATQTILLLVSFFVFMYWVDFIISFVSVLVWSYDPIILGVQKIVVNFYATVSPLVLIVSDKRVINIVKNMWQKHHQFLTSY
ncbi:putative vomeronasal receptor-like protein 4 [Hippopotamus amphibius kiboko]|uniref:putative vomeronasal receptor-like protein 4 n=1 Tax=Hippopotamus amphibius kiboko TaxID=575201 RepID=UPI0025913C7D|nr:putative vomeronasal receptor-like protein 4 [Hippopotamus amphibius kiboko]